MAKQQIRLQIVGVEGTEICVGERASNGDFVLIRNGIKRFQLITSRQHVDEGVWHDGYLIGGSKKHGNRQVVGGRIQIVSGTLMIETATTAGTAQRRLEQTRRRVPQTIHRFLVQEDK